MDERLRPPIEGRGMFRLGARQLNADRASGFNRAV
jgi:hypothetical protein